MHISLSALPPKCSAFGGHGPLTINGFDRTSSNYMFKLDQRVSKSTTCRGCSVFIRSWWYYNLTRWFAQYFRRLHRSLKWWVTQLADHWTTPSGRPYSRCCRRHQKLFNGFSMRSRTCVWQMITLSWRQPTRCRIAFFQRESDDVTVWTGCYSH